jgi:spectinomycin phosphotransferase
MREPPDLANATIIATLEKDFALQISALTFLPLGVDAASAGYRVQAANGATYFLKARALHGFRPCSLFIPRHLHEEGVRHIPSPLPTIAGTLWTRVNGFALSLVPFIEGQLAADAGLSAQHWTDLGSTVQQIHSSQLPPDLISCVPREAFTPSRREVLTQLQICIEGHAVSGAVQAELAHFWNAHREEIRALINQADELGRQLRKRALSLVLCHADLHTWNILLDAEGCFWLVDWDDVVFSPKERDLMFVIGGIGPGLVSAQESACFLEGYGEADFDPQALTYYRFAWAVQDMGAYGEKVFFSPGLGEASRRDALAGFRRLFEPGNIVDIAFSSDRAAP